MDERVLNGRYRLESEIGRGGMGIVYRAHDLSLNRTVAVKVLPPEFTHDEQFLQRFRAEILNSAKLDHPHIVHVYDVGEDDGTSYYVMQYIDGDDLHSAISQRGCFPVQDAVTVLNQIGQALDFAHEHGIVHRDIKPENILIDRFGTARVVDFGIAKTVEGTRLTGGMIGTPEYMSPEQARGEALDGRADQYSLAILAYEMLTGTTPFRSGATQPWAMVNMHISTPPPDPRQWQQNLSEPTVAALMQALAKVPAYRFPSCTAFIAGLSGAQPPVVNPTIPFSPGPMEPPPPVLPPPIPPKQNTPVGLIVLLVALLVVGVALLGVSANKHKEGGGGNEYSNSNSEQPEQYLPQPGMVISALPSSMHIGEYFDFTITGRNDGDTAYYGSVTVSFSGNPEVVALASDDPDPNIAYPGSKGLYVDLATDNTREIITSETFAEAYFPKQNWGKGGTRYLRLRVAPRETGTMLIKARCTINYGKDTAASKGVHRFYSYPALGQSEVTDQQGLPVEVYSVNVLPSDAGE